MKKRKNQHHQPEPGFTPKLIWHEAEGRVQVKVNPRSVAPSYRGVPVWSPQGLRIRLGKQVSAPFTGVFLLETPEGRVVDLSPRPDPVEPVPVEPVDGEEVDDGGAEVS